VTAVSDDERRRRLASRHRLIPSRRTDSVATIADALVALHSSDPVTVYLSIAARADSLTPADIERALYEERSVLRHHAMRRTLWVMTPAVAEVAHAACTRKLAATERRRTAKLLGDTEWLDRAVAEVIEVITSHPGPLTTRRIGEILPALRRGLVYGAGTKHESPGSAHTRAVLVAAFDGAIVRARPGGTWLGSQYAWIDHARWVSVDWNRHDEVAGASALVERWLASYGPGTLDDIVWWTGATKGLVRRALDHLDVQAVTMDAPDGGAGFVLAADNDTISDPGPWVTLLPGLDPTAMGWRHRSWYIDETTQSRVMDGFGNIGPTVWADGSIVGGWAQRPDGSIAVELTRDITDDHRDLLSLEIERLRRFVGDSRFSVRFPSPNQRELLA
jgi:hypothetical protein